MQKQCFFITFLYLFVLSVFIQRLRQVLHKLFPVTFLHSINQSYTNHPVKHGSLNSSTCQFAVQELIILLSYL